MHPGRAKINARFRHKSSKTEGSNQNSALSKIEENINQDYIQMAKKVYIETSEKVLGRMKKKNKQWLRENLESNTPTADDP